MTPDPLLWSIPFGRPLGTAIRVHWTLVAFAILKLIEELLSKRPQVAATAGWLSLLFIALAIHVAAQVVVGARWGWDADEFRVWPLGLMLLPSGGRGRGVETAIGTAAGPIANLVLAIVAASAIALGGGRMIFDPFGTPRVDAREASAVAREGLADPPAAAAPQLSADEAESAARRVAAAPRFGGGTPILADDSEAPTFGWIWWVGWFGYLNWMLCLVNCIPALPLEGGRIFRYLAASGERDRAIVPHTARACAIVLGVVGLLRWALLHKPGGTELLVLALLIDSMVRLEARMFEAGGFFEESLFGYDFSQGYTSLDRAGAPARRRRESAIGRWRRIRSEQRRIRSEQRRLRREAKLSAEEERMDEILAKLHREGRDSLTAEEQRFLVRVSARLRSRPRPSIPRERDER
jgi:Zn-dependent protease